MLDLRWPIGFMFTLIGVLLVGFGVANPDDSISRAGGADIKIDLIWGIVLLVFGGLMLLGAFRGKKNLPKA